MAPVEKHKKKHGDPDSHKERRGTPRARADDKPHYRAKHEKLEAATKLPSIPKKKTILYTSMPNSRKPQACIERPIAADGVITGVQETISRHLPSFLSGGKTEQKIAPAREEGKMYLQGDELKDVDSIR